MAQLDIKGFVTAEQDLGALSELTKTIAAQNAAQAKSASKKSQLEVKINPADYATGTIYDPYMKNRALDVKQKGIKYAIEHPDATAMELENILMDDVRLMSQDSEKLKLLQSQKVAGLKAIEKMPGADPVKFEMEFDMQAFKKNPDGTLPSDLSGIDINKNYVNDIIEKSPIWNYGAVDNLVTKAGMKESTIDVFVKDAKKGSRATKIDIKSPLNMQPVLDKDGNFAYDFEMPSVLLTDNGVPKLVPVIDENTGLPKKDTQGNVIEEPIKMLTLDDWESVKNDYYFRKYIDQEVRNQKKDPTTTEGENYARAIAYQLINANSRTKTKYSEKVAQVAAPAPVIKNVINTGDKKNIEIGDVYPRLKNILDKKIELHNANPSKYNPYQELNTLPTDLRKLVLKEARFSSGTDDLSAEFVKIMYDDNGVMGIYNAKTDKFIASLTQSDNSSESANSQSGGTNSGFVETSPFAKSKKTSRKGAKVTDQETLDKLNKD